MNFTAFDTRLVTTCASRVGSPESTAGTSGWQETTRSSPLSRADSVSRPAACSSSGPDLEVEPLQLQPAGLDLGEVEDVVDQPQERPAGHLHAGRQPLLLGV